MADNGKITIARALKVYHDSKFTPGVYEHSIFGQAALLLERDTVEVVRCENCEHWRWSENNMYGEDFGTCVECLMDTKKDHFCSYGERRSNATD